MADLHGRLSSVVDANDKRPMSVQRLERTCAQLQAMVTEQDRSIRALEQAIKGSVTKQHIEILLAGKVSQGDVDEMLAKLGNELGAMASLKVDAEHVEAVVGAKATTGSVESLRVELHALRDSIRAGDGFEALSAKQPASDPFHAYTRHMESMLAAIRDAQTQAREEEARKLAEAEAARGGPVHTGRFNADGTEILLNKDGSPWIDPTRALEMARAEAQTRAAMEAHEKQELRERIQRMELAIQLANAQNALRARGLGAHGGAGGGADEAARMDKALEARTGKMARAMAELRTQCAEGDEELKRLHLQLQKAKAAAAARHAKGGAAAIQELELQRFMTELGELQRMVAAAGGDRGARDIIKEELLPRAAELAANVEDMRAALREQARAQARLLDSMADARSSVAMSVADLYEQVQALRRRLKTHSEQLGRDVLRGVADAQNQARDMDQWRYEVEGAFDLISSTIMDSESTLNQLAKPLHDQLRAQRTTSLELREDEVEARFEGEYAKLRARYEVRRREEEAEAAAEAEEVAQRRRRLRSAAGVVMEEEKDSDYHHANGGDRFDLGSTTRSAWSMYDDIGEAFSPTPEPGDYHPTNAATPRSSSSRPRTSFRPSPPPSSHGGGGGPSSSPTSERPKTSPLKGNHSASTRRSSWNHTTASASNAGSAAPTPRSSRPSSSPRTQPRASSAALSSPSSSISSSPPAASVSMVGPHSGPGRAPLHAYVPAPDSSFQIASGQGPRWMRDVGHGRDRTASASGRSPTSSPERDDYGRLVVRDVTLPSRPHTARFDLKSASRARPNSGTGFASARGRSAAAGPTSSSSTSSAGFGLGMEHNDPSYSLELLRQRLSIPTPIPPPIPYRPVIVPASNNGATPSHSPPASTATFQSFSPVALLAAHAAAMPPPAQKTSLQPLAHSSLASKSSRMTTTVADVTLARR